MYGIKFTRMSLFVLFECIIEMLLYYQNKTYLLKEKQNQKFFFTDINFSLGHVIVIGV